MRAEPLPSYLRVHTCSGAEARLSVGCSCPPGPLRAVTQMVYLLPGSRALWGGEARERGTGRLCRQTEARPRGCDGGQGRPSAGGQAASMKARSVA